MRDKMLQEIDAISEPDFISMDLDILANMIAKQFHISCPTLSDDITYSAPSFSRDSTDSIARFYVPFSGDSIIFEEMFRHNRLLMKCIAVQPNLLTIDVQMGKPGNDELASKIRAIIKRINKAMEKYRNSLNDINADLLIACKQVLQVRQAERVAHRQILSDLEGTGFRMRRWNDGVEEVIIPVKPKVIASRSPAVAANHEPELSLSDPELSLSDYDEILKVIRSMVAVFERSPSVFRTMEEEHLRTILLVGLNGIFKGQASGETFNGAGKTDILIRAKDNNIFIAECLIWGGADHFRKKLTEQLFRYSTWRDSKLAAIVFNRNKHFTSAVQKMCEVAGGLSNCISAMQYDMETGCRHRFRRNDDPHKQFILTCLAFEVPV